MNFTQKTVNEIEAMTPEELTSYKALEKAHNDKQRTAEINSAIAKFKLESQEDSKKALKALEESMGKEFADQFAEISKSTQADKRQTIKEILEANKEDLTKSFNEGTKFEFNVSKAAALTTSVTGNTASQRELDISPLAVKKLSIYDLFRKVRVGKNSNGKVTVYEWDEATTASAAAMVAEGGTFPESTATWKESSVVLKKIGDSIPMSEEFKYDTALFADELQSFLNINVQVVQDAQILNGSGTGNNTTGLYTYAPAFTAVASGITDASIYDLIVKVAEGISKGKGGKFQANFVMLSLTDINRMRLKKDANNNYVMPPFVDREGNNVAGLTVIEENGLTNNTMLVGDSRYGKIYEDEDGFTITTGTVNNQFLQDMETLKARKRLAFFIRSNNLAGFAKVADIDASLVTLAA